MRKTKVVILGAGTAGLSAANEVQKKTDDFLLVESGELGTTCARIACMPSKVLIQIAEDFHRRRVFAKQGISNGEKLSIDTKAALARVREMRDHFTSGVVRSMKRYSGNLIRGQARFLAPNLISVGSEKIRAKRVVVATGSSPFIPEPWRTLGDWVQTSDQLFEWNDFPRSIAVLGVGPIGLELGQAMHRLGVRVEIFARSKKLGGLSDPKVNACAVTVLGEEIPFHFGEGIEVTSVRGKVRVKSKTGEVEVERVLACVGRKPNLHGLGLETLGIDVDQDELPLDRGSLQLGDLPIFLAGDVGAENPVLHVANEEGAIAGRNSVARKIKHYDRKIPMGIAFCHPNIAVVGTAFCDLPKNVRIGEVDFSNQGRSTILSENRGMLRVYASKAKGTLLGAEMIGPRAEHLAHFLALAIHHKLSVAEILEAPFYHPVVEEGLRTALKSALA